MNYHTPCRKQPAAYYAAMAWWRSERRPTNPFSPRLDSARDLRARGILTCADIVRHYRAHVRWTDL